MIIGVLGAMIEFRRQHPVFPTRLDPLPSRTQEKEEPPLYLDPAVTPPIFTSQGVWIFERGSDSLLYSYRAEEATSVASLAKLMTAFVAYETYDLEDQLTVGEAAFVEGNRAKFLQTDLFSVRDLLQALLMFSANDAAETLASGLPEGKAYFLQRMNTRAEELGMKHSHFSNPTGLDETGQYSSAEDIGHLVDTFLEVPFFEQTVRQTTTQVTEQRTGRIDTIYTTNTMLYRDTQYTGVKTGTTDQAGQSLVLRIENTWSLPDATGSASLDQPVDIVLVILGSQDRYLDASNFAAWLEQALRSRKNSVS